MCTVTLRNMYRMYLYRMYLYPCTCITCTCIHVPVSMYRMYAVAPKIVCTCIHVPVSHVPVSRVPVSMYRMYAVAPKIVEAETPLVQIVSVGSEEEREEGRGEDALVKCKVLGEKYDIVWRLGGVVIASNRWKNTTLSSESADTVCSETLHCHMHAPSPPSSLSPSLPPSLSLSVTGSRYKVLSSGSLLIRSNNLGDSGCYQCFVGNRAGNSTARIQLIATGM